MKKAIIIAIIILALIIEGILYTTHKETYITSTSETSETIETTSETTSTILTPLTKTTPTPTTQYFPREEVEVPFKTLKYNFTSDKGFEKTVNVTSAMVYYYLTIRKATVTGENPKLTVRLKVIAHETTYTGLLNEVNLGDIELPYVVRSDEWFYITENCEAKCIINVNVYDVEVQGELTIILQELIELNYNKEYLIKNNYGFLIFKIKNNENNLIFLRKKPKGGEVEAIQLSEEFSDCLITKFSHNWWSPTGIVADLSSVIIPSYYIRWGGHTVNGKIVKGGWMKRVFSSDDLFIIIKSEEKEYVVALSEVSNIGSLRSAPDLKTGDLLNLPTASHVEGVIFNVSVNNAPAVITLELKVKTGEKVPSEFWIGANLVNSSSIVVSTTPLVIVPGKSRKVLIYLVTRENGMHAVWLSYNTGSIAEIGFTVKLLSIEPTDLGVFKYNEEWNVWEGKIEYR